MTIFRDFIDIHTHGIGKYDTRTGSPDNILQIAALHLSQGTGSILPTIYPDDCYEHSEIDWQIDSVSAANAQDINIKSANR